MIQFDLKRRWVCFLTGITLSGFGVAMTTRAGIGTTPISSVPYVLSMISPLSIGMWTLLMNVFFVLIQWLILRKEFPRHQLLQIPATFLFGMIIDLGMFVFRPLVSDFYPYQILMLIGGSALLAAGIALQVMTDLLCLPGDAIVKIVSEKLRWNFGKLKISFDVTLTTTAIVISQVSLSALRGVREGTVAGAFCVGTLVALLMPRLRFARKLCYVRK